MMFPRPFRPAVAVILTSLALAAAQAAESPMNNQRLGALIQRIDENAEGGTGFWRATVAGRTITVITDENADRMRIISPVARADNLDPALMLRMLQANFDTALDARYSVAKGVLWSLYLHPLAALSDEQFLAGIGQVVNLAASYGSTYSSGGLSFGGGDSNDLIQQLLDKGLSI
ncbi:MAG: hypothetical protein BMS9Abin14_007 [Gammaproteobacteria bacterium]|nr:MAG: hypothetical protein BMS9Abin14_007 [Gammaproteobacteria bacterium]